MSRTDSPIFDAIVRIDRLPAAGRSIKIAADETARAELAKILKVVAVEAVEATLSVTPLRGGIRALGHLTARIVQASVVSFEPVSQDIDEAIDRVFLPESTGHTPTPGSEVFVDLEDDDFPDQLDGPELDLSALLIETIALAIEPYPRLPGESLESLGLKDDGLASGPFAALTKLKKSTDIDR
ncbi:MAG: YceD family protein [Devosia sp.]